MVDLFGEKGEKCVRERRERMARAQESKRCNTSKPEENQEKQIKYGV